VKTLSTEKQELEKQLASWKEKADLSRAETPVLNTDPTDVTWLNDEINPEDSSDEG